MSSGETDTRWFAIRSSVRENQNRERPVRTRPLSGISVGRTTSNALRRSDATRRSRSWDTAYRSRTLPERRKVSASGLEAGLQAVETGDDGGDVAEEGAVVEAGVEVGERDPLGDLRIDCEQVAEWRALVCCAERGPLDDRVGSLAAHPAALDEDPEDAAAGVQPEAALDVPAHPFGTHDEPVDEARHPDEEVVEDDGGVGQDHPLGARVADVALVPERLVLEGDDRVAAQQAGQARDALAQDRVALVGHRAGALLAGLEGLHHLADLGVLKVPDLGREALEAASQHGDRGQ